MSVLHSMYGAVGGISAHGEAISVVGDNIANVNTVGYKSTRGRFESVLGGTMAASFGSDRFTGQGVRLAGTTQAFTQGSIIQTGRRTDVAIQGDGFFVVRGAYHGNEGTFFTRDGQLSIDATGHLVSAQGLRVQGYTPTSAGVLGTQIGDLRIPIDAQLAPRATANVAIRGNLDCGRVTDPPFDPSDPTGFASSVVVYDSKGAERTLDIYFEHAADGTWTWHAMADGAQLQNGVAGQSQEVASGVLTFNSDGLLQQATGDVFSVDFADDSTSQALRLDFGDSLASGGSGRSAVTSFASASAFSRVSQDGNPAADLTSFRIDADGRIVGLYSTGDEEVLGQLATASFGNNDGLLEVGSGMYAASTDSGTALIGQPGIGGHGAIASFAVEQSNVDLAEELVSMIAYQRGFQANSRTIQTADELLAELNNLKR